MSKKHLDKFAKLTNYRWANTCDRCRHSYYTPLDGYVCKKIKEDKTLVQEAKVCDLFEGE